MIKQFSLIMALLIAGSLLVFAGGEKESGGASAGPKTYSIFLGRPAEDYPTKGTILGDYLEKKTGVKINFEFVVGEVKQKVGLMIAGGEYPDAMDGRNDNQAFYDAGAFIPLNDLIDKYGPNIKKYLGDKIDMLRKKDGNIYWLPAYWPYGDKVQAARDSHALYIQKAVLKENNWPIPANLEEATDMLIEYAKKYPEINGKPTKAFTALSWSWREFPLMNAPHIFSGHPNEGEGNVDWVNGKWKFSRHWDTEEAYRVYKIYNKIHLAGFWDEECFIMDYDQYIAKLTTGSVLAFYDQNWQFQDAQKILRDQGKGRFYVGLPVVMKGFEEEFEGPLQPQISEGVGISVNCKDPVGLIKYFNFLASEEFVIAKNWGFEGEHYMVDDKGLFYRTPEQIEKFDDKRWNDYVFGQKYWVDMISYDGKSMFSDGLNVVDMRNQPSIFYARLKPGEKEVLNAYGKKTWAEFFKKPDMRRAKYFPLWTAKIPTGSDVDIAKEKIKEIRRKYTPRLIMAPAGEYDSIWQEYVKVVNEVPNHEKIDEFYQNVIDERMKAAGGY